MRDKVLEYARDYFSTEPEAPFADTPENVVLRRADNRKWYGLIMTVRADKLGLLGEEPMDILNVKCDPNLSGSLRLNPGIIPGYHMNKESWISIFLDGSVPLEQIQMLLNLSYDLTAPKRKIKKSGTV